MPLAMSSFYFLSYWHAFSLLFWNCFGLLTCIWGSQLGPDHQKGSWETFGTHIPDRPTGSPVWHAADTLLVHGCCQIFCCCVWTQASLPRHQKAGAVVQWQPNKKCLMLITQSIVLTICSTSINHSKITYDDAEFGFISRDFHAKYQFIMS